MCHVVITPLSDSKRTIGCDEGVTLATVQSIDTPCAVRRKQDLDNPHTIAKFSSTGGLPALLSRSFRARAVVQEVPSNAGRWRIPNQLREACRAEGQEIVCHSSSQRHLSLDRGLTMAVDIAVLSLYTVGVTTLLEPAPETTRAGGAKDPGRDARDPAMQISRRTQD
jgi:hypothetical protein